MAKVQRFFDDRDVTLKVNDTIYEYLEDLGKTGLYGNTHGQAAEIVLRIGLKQLIDSGQLKPKEHQLAREAGS
jgi:hypothetical protein